jgi:hypothetical protein
MQWLHGMLQNDFLFITDDDFLMDYLMRLIWPGKDTAELGCETDMGEKTSQMITYNASSNVSRSY